MGSGPGWSCCLLLTSSLTAGVDTDIRKLDMIKPQQEDQELEASLSYTVSWRLAWLNENLFSHSPIKKKKKKSIHIGCCWVHVMPQVGLVPTSILTIS